MDWSWIQHVDWSWLTRCAEYGVVGVMVKVIISPVVSAFIAQSQEANQHNQATQEQLLTLHRAATNDIVANHAGMCDTMKMTFRQMEGHLKDLVDGQKDMAEMQASLVESWKDGCPLHPNGKIPDPSKVA